MNGLPTRLASAAALAWLLAAQRAEAVKCTIDATSAVAFGAYNIASGTPNDSVGTITYSCNGNSGATVTLGTGASGTYAARTMTAGGPDVLSYNLYANAARTQVWGDSSAGTTSQLVPSASGVVISVYGRIPALQNIAAGSYSDSVVVTFTF